MIRVEENKKLILRTYLDAKQEMKARIKKDTVTELEDRLRGKYGVKFYYKVLDSRTEKEIGE